MQVDRFSLVAILYCPLALSKCLLVFTISLLQLGLTGHRGNWDVTKTREKRHKFHPTFINRQVNVEVIRH